MDDGEYTVEPGSPGTGSEYVEAVDRKKESRDMGNSYLYGYTEKKALAKARKRGMTLMQYVDYLRWKQENRSRNRRLVKTHVI